MSHLLCFADYVFEQLNALDIIFNIDLSESHNAASCHSVESEVYWYGLESAYKPEYRDMGFHEVA